MGVSDRPYFAWLRGALERFEAGSGTLAGIRAHERAPVLWVLAGARPNPATDFVAEALGPVAVTRFLDRFAAEPGVVRADFNALGELPVGSCDVLMMTRASYMVENPRAYLADTRRLLRPGGCMIVDWIHGGGHVPVPGVQGVHVYAGESVPFRTTYADATFLGEFPAEVEAFIRHVNRPPWRASPAAALRRLLGGGEQRHLTPATYIDAVRADLSGAGGHLIEPGLMEEYFKVAFREAKYFYPLSGKFYLHLLTVLRPVGA